MANGRMAALNALAIGSALFASPSWGVVAISDVHITQATQSDLVPVPFVANRPTAVRVTVQANRPILSASLRVEVDGNGFTPPGGLPPLNDLPWFSPAVVDFENESHTLNFEVVAPSIPPSTQVTFIVRVTDADGNLAQHTVPHQIFRKLNCLPQVTYLQIVYPPAGPGIPFADLEAGTGDAFLRGVMPFERLGGYEAFPYFSIVYEEDENGDGELDQDPDGNTLLEKLASIREFYIVDDMPMSSRDYLYGFVNGNPMPENGLAAVRGQVAFGNSEEDRYQKTLAHLLGINLGLPQQGPLDDIEDVGWDVSARLPGNPAGNDETGRVKPGSDSEYMVGSIPSALAWTGAEEYRDLVNAFTVCLSDTSYSDPVFMTGSISSLGDAVEKLGNFLPPNLDGMPNSSAPNQILGGFELRLLDSGGGITTVGFDPLAASDASGNNPGNGFFAISAGLPPGRQLDGIFIENRQTQQVIYALTNPGAPPTAQISSPGEGETITNGTAILWNPIDPDTPLENLHAAVLYSPSPGTWIPLAVNLDGLTNSLNFDPSLLPPSAGQGVIRVLINDGLRGANFEVTGLTVLPTSDVTPGWSASPLRLLVRSYPNPTDGRSSIAYALESSGPVRIDLHDATGRLIRTLLDGRMPAGRHDTIWDGRDGEGHPVPAGVYFGYVHTAEGTGVTRVTRVD